MPLSGHPPHRSRRAVFPHRAPRFELSLLPHQASVSANRHRVVPCALASVHYTGHPSGVSRGLSYPLTARLPARSSRRSLCHPCWLQGTCTRLSRAQTTTNRSDSPTPICSAPISSLRIPRHPCRGGAEASHVSHISLTTCHALGLRWLSIPNTPAFLPTTMHFAPR